MNSIRVFFLAKPLLPAKRRHVDRTTPHLRWSAKVHFVADRSNTEEGMMRYDLDMSGRNPLGDIAGQTSPVCKRTQTSIKQTANSDAL
jgi:hypothetical protein